MKSPISAMFSEVQSRQLMVLLVLAGCLFFLGLGWLPLLEPDEGRNAEVAREMLDSGDLITPHFNGLPYLDKPPVFFWLVAGCFRLAGVSELTARLPSAVAALATMLLVWFLARRIFGLPAGLRAGVIFATSPLILAFSRLVIFDMTLAFLMTLAMTSFWLADSCDNRRAVFDVLFFASMGVAAITKGPVGFILPLLSVATYKALGGHFRDLKGLRWGLGLTVFFAATLPWFIAVSVQNPGFPRYALLQESLQRFASGSARRTGAFLYYVPVYLAGFFPWSFFLLFAGWNHLKKWRALKQEAQKPVVFLLAWFGVTFAFFSISQSKLPGYFLPAIVPLSILTARVWEEVGASAKDGPARPDWLTAGFAGFLAVGLLAAAAPQLFRFAAVQIGATEKMNPTVVDLAKPSLFFAGLILLALGIIGRNLASRAQGTALSAATFVLLALTVPLLVVRWRATLKTFFFTSSARELAQKILASPGRDLPIYGYYCFRPSLVFYLRRPVGLVTADASELTSNYVSSRLPELRGRGRLSSPPGGSGGIPVTEALTLQYDRLLLDATDLQARSRYSSQASLVIARNRDVRKLSQVVDRLEPLWSDWEYSVWKIPPAEAAQGTGHR